jgi:5'-nucleotidase
VTYSGTISAAFEAALAGIKAVALSQAMRDAGHGFSAAEHWAERVLAPLLAVPLARRTLVNVNFPALAASDVKGIRVVRQGFHDYARGSLVEGTDPRGRPYYWFGLEDAEHTLDHGTDLEAIEDGYVAVTPLHVDLTHPASIGALAEGYAA